MAKANKQVTQYAVSGRRGRDNGTSRSPSFLLMPAFCGPREVACAEHTTCTLPITSLVPRKIALLFISFYYYNWKNLMNSYIALYVFLTSNKLR